MTDLSTARLAMPLLALAQAQKELIHNEALALIDILLHPVALGVADDPGALAPDAGQCWIIGDQPLGEWSGRAGQIAGWTAGGWRYALPLAGMQLVDAGAHHRWVYRQGQWTAAPELAPPSGGSVIDVEARDSLAAVLEALDRAGLAVPAGA